MSKKSSKALFSSIYENDVCVLGNNALDYTKVKNVEYLDDDMLPQKNKKRQQQFQKTQNETKIDPHAILNKGAISKKIIHCNCNKCGYSVDATMISYIQLQASQKSIPFVAYFCGNCRHSGHRSVQALALPYEEFDRVYFS